VKYSLSVQKFLCYGASRVRRPLSVNSVTSGNLWKYSDCWCLCNILWQSCNCNSVLAGAPRSAADKLQRVLNAAARLVSGTRIFDRGLSRLLHVDLHWLDVPERVQYKLSVTVHRCQQHKAPQYLIDCVTPASDIASRQRLRSANRHQLLVPRHWLSSLGHRSFAVAGQWFGICCQLTSVIGRVATSLSDVHWKHSCSLSTSVSSALEVFLRRAI